MFLFITVDQFSWALISWEINEFQKGYIDILLSLAVAEVAAGSQEMHISAASFMELQWNPFTLEKNGPPSAPSLSHTHTLLPQTLPSPKGVWLQLCKSFQKFTSNKMNTFFSQPGKKTGWFALLAVPKASLTFCTSLLFLPMWSGELGLMVQKSLQNQIFYDLLQSGTIRHSLHLCLIYAFLM